MKEIPLTQGKFALVDDEDFEWLNQWKWYALKYPKNGVYYAARNIRKGGKCSLMRMHREIMKTPKGLHTDHANNDSLDNRKYNLRPCTHSQNQMNRKKNENNTSGYKGVSWHEQGQKWQARIKLNSQKKSLGLFNIKEDAAIAYNEAAKKYFGEFARLNIVGLQ